MVKLISFVLFSMMTLGLNAQASLYVTKEQEKKQPAETKECENTLVSTFSKYFSKPSDPAKKETVKSTTSTNTKLSDYASTFYNSTIDNIISVGKMFLGIPYRWGGTSESGFDCSGFIKYIFEWFGIQLPRTSREMANYGDYVSKNELQKGDLIFFSGRNMNSGVIGHIGIVVEVTNEAIKMMHSSSSQGVHIEDLNQSVYFSKRYMTARRLPIAEPTKH
jgi:cell wall-associated NlpC family hydrolase